MHTSDRRRLLLGLASLPVATPNTVAASVTEKADDAVAAAVARVRRATAAWAVADEACESETLQSELDMDAAQAELRASYLALAAIPAATLRGCALKAGAVLAIFEDMKDFEGEIAGGKHTHDVRVSLSIVRDLARIGDAA